MLKNGLNKRLSVDLGKYYESYADLLAHTALETDFTLA